MNTPTETNVIDITNARSYSPNKEARWVDMTAVMHHFSLSRATVKNYANGYFMRNGERQAYEKGPMPSIKLPGGRRRFNLDEAEAWLRASSENSSTA